MGILNQELSLKTIAGLFKGRGKSKKNNARLKTTINFVGIDETSENWGLAVPFTILIIIAAVLISKFAVADRYAVLWEKQSEVTSLEDQLADGMTAINDASELSDKFYHYTWSVMNDEERSRVSRVDIASLITYIGSQGQSVNSYTVSGDMLTVNITSPTLQSISMLALSLEDRDIVESTSVQTAQTDSGDNAAEGVEAQIIIYLAGQAEEEE